MVSIIVWNFRCRSVLIIYSRDYVVQIVGIGRFGRLYELYK